MSEPGGNYLTHVTPEGGTGRAIARELVDLVRERNIDLVVMGMDGTSVNTGIHNGAIRLTELELMLAVQHIICLLHLNELPLRPEALAGSDYLPFCLKSGFVAIMRFYGLVLT